MGPGLCGMSLESPRRRNKRDNIILTLGIIDALPVVEEDLTLEEAQDLLKALCCRSESLNDFGILSQGLPVFSAGLPNFGRAQHHNELTNF